MGYFITYPDLEYYSIIFSKIENPRNDKIENIYDFLLCKEIEQFD